ncbi:winged helix-turn-helix domain-containing protein [Fulvimonas sp. R45]|uniref:winged helix-turn-helix domain-containing protein n=1 Tax=Fulvimonas sp. R45 TaxID=3045937 RepID=UPI00265EE87B|nr:winged helix-turn-helix domain-containing protein [Fulvimonas sp. R45]MDO1529149.1 winged helix-turn-helix domain-containing protein [Fulvimonas sp. R45]
MDRPRTTPLRIGAWRIDPSLGEISREGETLRLETRTLRTLLCLAERAGQVVGIDELLDEVWAGVIVTSDSVYQAIASLRRALGDDPRNPSYIATVPRLGYRLVAAVEPLVENAPAPASAVAAPPPARKRRRLLPWAVAAVALALGLIAFRYVSGALTAPLADRTAPTRSIAVMPFLDLTAAMDEEPFADGMTEELIDKLGRIPGLRVSARTDTFYFKHKRATIAEIARELHVDYVLEGSVRKSGRTMRVTTQLVRSGDGYLAWAGSYDRPASDILAVQDEIAAEVVRALRAGTLGQPPPRSPAS